ncbi:MAG TPA: NADH-ubiquinone oxidoreductase-F iron-sulfur binding region domain-containing protein [Solirubrobacteraceae bacterium]|nr:NADH-ubiquinone oxidoreductase-F iron-sulfur binding region domain-containing protein [Solirubrobacteraceae bacterium]
MSAPALARREAPAYALAPQGLPRLLAAVPAHGAMSLERHHAVHGPAPFARGRRAGHVDLSEELQRSGLRGRGGAAFPTAAKLRAVRSARGRPVVLVNAAESEPASAKDRLLTAALPHLVLDGAWLAAQALGARELVVGVCETARASGDALAVAIAERAHLRGAPRTQLLNVPHRYVASQETALASFAAGGPALPTFAPPRPSERGVRGRPTLVLNAETSAHVALIARHGGHWFRELGTAAQPGSALVTLSGAVARPGVYEIEPGSSLASLLHAAGGTTAQVRALLAGGYGGAWIGAEQLDGLALSHEGLSAHGASLGAGVLALLSADACPVAEVARLARWLAAEGAGQCGPCTHGLDAIAAELCALAAGGAGAGAPARLERLAALVRGRGACAHPDGAARMTASALGVFAVELADHARHGPCERCLRTPELALERP